jgi:4-hydroxybenzoate polyprenyltransferase
VFAGLVFGWKLSDPTAIALAVLAFGCFCLVASASYVINDLVDREQDRLHPTKRNRPIASGAIEPGRAGVVCAALLLLAAIVATRLLPARFTVILATYFILILTYSFFLKRLVILDVITISIGFVLRAWGGAAAIDVDVSQWLIVCTFTLCLFLGFGKRRCEHAVIANGANAVQHRATLERYTTDLLNQLLSISAGLAVITFMLYTMEKSTPPPPFPRWMLIYTVPLVIYGVFRYAMLIESGKITGPTDIIINDRPFLATGVMWLMLAGLIVYEGERIARFLKLPDPTGGG